MSNFTSFMSSKCCWRDHFGEDESFSPCSRERRSLHSNSANTQPGKELFEGRVPESEGRVPDGEDRKMLWVICKSCHSWSCHRSTERTELVESQHGRVQVGILSHDRGPFRSLQNFVQSDRTIVVLVWETSEKREIATGWSRLHRVDDSG